MSITGFNLYELAYMYRQGEERCLRMILEEVRPLLKKQLSEMTAKYPPLEVYYDDLLQEAYITASYALDTFRDDGEAGIQTYLLLIMKRRIVQQARRTCESKAVQLHKAVSVDGEPTGKPSLHETIPDHQCWYDPEFMLAYNNACDRLADTVQEMKASDFYIASCWAEGKSYKESCDALNISFKSYDGRLQRVKKKIHDGVYGLA